MSSRARVFLVMPVVAALAALSLAIAPLPARADTGDFTFDSFDADYTLTRSSDGAAVLDVVETIVAVFPESDQNRGIIRAIPKYYQRVDLETTVRSVVDERGADVPYEESDSGEFIELALGTDDYVHGETTYEISYSQRNVVGSFEDTDTDEFYWDVNGTGWEQPFGAVSAEVHIDQALGTALTGQAACYRGVQDSTEQCTIASQTEVSGGTSFSVSERSLGPGENVTLAIAFTPDTFTQGEKTQPVPRATTSEAPWWSVMLASMSGAGALLLTAFAIVGRVRRGTGPAGKGFIIPQYTVPDGLNVMVAAHLVKRSANAIPAQLVSLAVRGKLRILDYPVTGSGADYTLQFLTTDDTDEHERTLLAVLFGTNAEPGKTRELAPKNVTLGAAVRAIDAEAKKGVVSAGLREAWKPRGCLFPVLSVLLLVVACVNAFATAAAFSTSAWPWVSILVVVAAVVASACLAQWEGFLTEKGVETRDYLRGMQMYLTLAEQDRFRLLQSPDSAERIDIGDTRQIVKLYEKLLPFAVLWGVEKEWAKELEVRMAEVDEQPDWFHGRSGFSTIAFASALRGVSTAATYSPPSSSAGGSGSGGAGGGGFSGGGGGGGGGGGR